MMAAELYQKTLAGYEASLGKGESTSLSRYCKIHHVNNRGLRYWMKKNSIISPKGKSGRLAGPSVSNNTTQPVPGSHQMVPLLISVPMPPMKFTGSYYPIAGRKNKPLNRARKKPETRSMGIAETLTF